MVKKSFTTRNEIVSNQTFAFTPIQSISLLLLYFVGMNRVSLLGQWLTQIIFGYEGAIHPTIALAVYIVCTVLFMLIVGKQLWGSFKHFSAHFIDNLSKVLQTWGMMLGGSILVGLVLSVLLPQGSQAGNQTVIESAFWKAPLFMAFNIVVFAPIVEELIFRGVLYQSFRTKKTYWPAVVISCFIFALLHVIQPLIATGDLKELIYLFQYAFLAFFMIIAYEKTGSIWGAILVHFLNNALSLIQFFL